MLICIITVHPERKAKLEEKFAFLSDGRKHEVRVCVFEKATGYTFESDHNSAVIKSIYANTKACISMGEPWTLVIQEDVVFPDEARALDGVRMGESFMDTHPEADLFFLGAHPNARHSKATEDVLAFRYAIHWQAVIFRKGVLEKFPETIPDGVHNDAYIADHMVDRYKAYGLKAPVALQDMDTKLRRKWEYGVLYPQRYRYPYGDFLRQLRDGLAVLLVVVVLVLSFM